MNEPLVEKRSFSSSVFTLPLLLLSAIIGFIPMIVYMRLVTFDGIAGEVYGPSVQGDLFSFYKSVWICILTAATLLWYQCNQVTAENWYHRPLAVYCFFVIISTIFADHWQIAFFGDPHRHEGLLVHLSYMGIVFLFINQTKDRRSLKLLLCALLTSGSILAVFGVLQFFGVNPYTESADWLLLSERVRSLRPGISLAQMTVNMDFIFITFGNGNFTGSYMAMLFALTFALAMLADRTFKFALVPINLIIFFNLLGSKSRAGLLGALVAGIVLILFLRYEIRRSNRRLALLLLCFCLMPFFMDAFTWKKTGAARFLETSIARPAEVKGRLFGNFQDLRLATDSFSFVFDNLKTEVKLNKEIVEFYDHKGELVTYSLLPNPNLRIEGKPSPASFSALPESKFNIFKQTSVDLLAAATTDDVAIKNVVATGVGDAFFPSHEYLLVFPETKMRGFLVYAWPEYNVLEIGRGGVSFFVANTDKGFKLLNQFGKPVDVQEVDAFGFADCQSLGSNRGYIWSRTLPMLKRALMVGYGPDTFAFHFPNHDYLGKMRVWSRGIFTMIEKPHNLYLQIAVNSGLISLFAILALFVAYLRESVKIYWQCRFERFSEVAGLGIMAAVIAYLVAAIFNDSIVGVAPVFWGLLGMGIAANRINLEAAK